MGTANFTSSVTLGGVLINCNAPRTDSGAIGHDLTLAAGLAGAITTGVVTLAGGHGLTDADKVDVHWAGGARDGCTIASYDGTSITLTGGNGDALPTGATAVVVQEPLEVDTDFDGDLASIIAGSAAQRATFVFYADTDRVYGVTVAAGEGFQWVEDLHGANPLAEHTITHVTVSNGTTAAGSAKLGIQYAST